MKLDTDHAASQWVEFAAAGVSMGRRWGKVDRLLGERMPTLTVRWSDVVVYELSGRLIAHRVVRCMNDGRGSVLLVTKGDGYWTPDRISVSLDNVKAVVRAIGINDDVRDVNRGYERWAGLAQAICGWLTSLIWRPLRLTVDGNIRQK